MSKTQNEKGSTMAEKKEMQVREKKELVAKEEKTVAGRYFIPCADIYETDEAERIVAEPTWFARAGFDAGDLLETQKRWAEAVKVYQRLIQSGFPCGMIARQRLEKIRSEHPEAVPAGK